MPKRKHVWIEGDDDGADVAVQEHTVESSRGSFIQRRLVPLQLVDETSGTVNEPSGTSTLRQPTPYLHQANNDFIWGTDNQEIPMEGMCRSQVSMVSEDLPVNP